MPAIDRLCRGAGVAPSDLSRVAVSIGPGGFTSIRIAVATAKMIALATGARPVGVPTALAVAHAVREQVGEAVLAVLLAWKRTDVWRQRFRVAPSIVEPIDAGGLVAIGPGAFEGAAAVVADAELRRLLGREGVSQHGVPVHDPVFDAGALFEASLRLPATDPSALLPLYPREPEAVTKWKALRASDRPGGRPPGSPPEPAR